MNMRRRLALWLCPDLLKELGMQPQIHPCAMSEEMAAMADHIRKVDLAFTKHFGEPISFRNAPEYTGRLPHDLDYKMPIVVRRTSINVAVRLRRNPVGGARTNTVRIALVYFAKVLPRRAWPKNVPRPSEPVQRHRPNGHRVNFHTAEILPEKIHK